MGHNDTLHMLELSCLWGKLGRANQESSSFDSWKMSPFQEVQLVLDRFVERMKGGLVPLKL